MMAQLDKGGGVKPAAFDYHAPTTVSDAVGLLAEHGDDAKPLAGGQSLVPMLAMRLARFEHLVDLNGVADLTGVRVDGDVLRIAAMTRQRDIGRDPLVAEHAPLLAEATPHIGHFQIRNRGTIGGSVAHADPAAEYPAVALALDASIEVTSATGNRTIPAAEFFESTFVTTLAPDELLTAVLVPRQTGRTASAFDEIARRHGDFALVGAGCSLGLDDAGRIDRASIGMMGLGSAPRRAEAAEAALIGASPDDVDAAEIGRLATADTDPTGDIHASADYRVRAGAHLVGRTLTTALARLENPDA